MSSDLKSHHHQHVIVREGKEGEGRAHRTDGKEREGRAHRSDGKEGEGDRSDGKEGKGS